MLEKFLLDIPHLTTMLEKSLAFTTLKSIARFPTTGHNATHSYAAEALSRRVSFPASIMASQVRLPQFTLLVFTDHVDESCCSGDGERWVHEVVVLRSAE